METRMWSGSERVSDGSEDWRLSGALTIDLLDEFWSRTSFRFGVPGEDYELVGSDEGEQLGLTADDPYWTGLRRKSDGQLFELEVEATARAVTPHPVSECKYCHKRITATYDPAAPQEHAAVWVDDSGGDVCGWDGGNEPHEPKVPS
jgi:hypothetical protein